MSPASSLEKLFMVPEEELLQLQHRVRGLFPGQATTSRPCKLETNHFTINLKVPNGMIYMYDVTVETPWKRPYGKSDKKLYHDAI